MLNRRNRLFAGALATVAAVATFTTTSAQMHGDHMHAEVGKPAPDFTLMDLDGKEHTLSDYTDAGKIVVLEWFNPDCPYVVKHHKRFKTMKELEAKYRSKGVKWLAINSGREGHSTTGSERNARAIDEYEIEYPVLLDYSGEVGHTYGAKTTPHMYIIDTDGVLVYAGAIDNNRNPTKLGDVNYVEQAINEVLAGQTVSQAETRPYGCSVKY